MDGELVIGRTRISSGRAVDERGMGRAKSSKNPACKTDHDWAFTLCDPVLLVWALMDRCGNGFMSSSGIAPAKKHPAKTGRKKGETKP